VRERTSVLYEATNLTAPAQLAGAVAQIREYFSEYPGAQPPLPHNLHELTPCSVRITETEADTGLKTGTVIITKPDGVVLYETEWTIEQAPEK
jgi:hypothetical protein